MPDTKSLVSEAESALSSAASTTTDALHSASNSLAKAEKEYTKEASALQRNLESILGGKARFWVEKDVDGKRLGNNMIGWGVFGLGVHAWHRGIQKMPVLSRPLRPYAIAFPIWALLGYYIHHFELRQEEVLAERRLLLRRNRGLLTDKDLEQVAVSNAFRDGHEKRAKLLIPAHSSSEKKVEESPMAQKVRQLASNNEMEIYGKKLNEKLEEFEREFEKQGKATNPIISSSTSWTRHTYSSPSEAKEAYSNGAFPPSSSTSSTSTTGSKSFFGSLFGKSRSKEELDVIKDWEAEQDRREKERFEKLPREIREDMAGVQVDPKEMGK